MRPKITITRKRVNKNMEKLIRKAENDLNLEASRQIDLVTTSMIIALYRYWNYRTDRISKILNVQQTVWDECGADNTLSMLKICDEECNVELTNYEGVSYRDVIYLNAEIDTGKPLSDAQWLVMRQNQKKWVKAQMLACMCVSMHRAEGWGFKRLSELMLKMDDIQADYNDDPDKLSDVALKECGYDWRGVNQEKKVG